MGDLLEVLQENQGCKAPGIVVEAVTCGSWVLEAAVGGWGCLQGRLDGGPPAGGAEVGISLRPLSGRRKVTAEGWLVPNRGRP